MISQDTLYYVSSNGASEAPALTGAPTHFGATEGGSGAGTAGWDVMSGYSSGTLLADVGGPYGTMVYGTGGHTRLQNQLLGLDLNADNPTFSWYQQPTYKTSATGGAELYYDPVTANGFPITRIIPGQAIYGTVGTSSTPTTTQFTPSALAPSSAGVDTLLSRTLRFDDNTATVALRGISRLTTSNGSGALPLITLASALPVAPSSGDTFQYATEDAGRWDRGFPVAFDGWIYPAKKITGQMGDNVPHGFRYSSVGYVPSSMTGTDSMLFAGLGPQGPFAQSNYPYTTSTLDEWTDPSSLWTDDYSNLRAKGPYYFKNLRTNSWTEHKWKPNYAPYNFPGLMVGVFTDTKRIYMVGTATAPGHGTGLGYWYLDMSSGFGSHTVGAWTVPSGNNAGYDFAEGGYFSGAFTDKHPAGRHIGFFPDINFADALLAIDFDSNTIVRLHLGSLGFTWPFYSEKIGMSYDPVGNRILMLLQDDTTHALSYYSIGLPADPMSATGYTVTSHNVNTSTGGMPLSDTAGFYGKTRIHPTLGCILAPTEGIPEPVTLFQLNPEPLAKIVFPALSTLV